MPADHAWVRIVSILAVLLAAGSLSAHESIRTAPHIRAGYEVCSLTCTELLPDDDWQSAHDGRWHQRLCLRACWEFVTTADAILQAPHGRRP